MNKEFDWSKFEKVPNELKEPINISSEKAVEPKSNQFNWSNFETIPKEPGFLEESARHIGRSASRAVETVAGLPGDIVNLALNAPAKAAELITGEKVPESAMKIARAFIPGAMAPTSSELREVSKTAFNGYLEPKNEKEKFSDEIVSDFASLLIPVKGKIPFVRSMLSAIGGNVLKKGSELTGLPDWASQTAKIGSMFLISAYNPKGAEKYVNNLFSSSRERLPKNAKVGAQDLLKDLSKVEKELSRGGSAAYKNPSLTKIKEIKGKIKKGNIPVDDLTQFKIDINQARSALYKNTELTKSSEKMAKRYLDQVAASVDNSLNQYAKTNPKWGELYQSANEGFGAINQSKKFVRNLTGFATKHPYAAGAAIIGKLVFTPKTAIVAGLGYSAIKAGEVMVQIAKNKTLRHYYQELVKSTLKNNSSEIAKNLKKLDEGLKKEQK